MNDSVTGLINKMETSLNFVENASQVVDKLKLLEDTTTELLNKITECSNFVRDYIDSSCTFWGKQLERKVEQN